MKKNNQANIINLYRSILENKELIIRMTKRNILGKYKGSFFGLFWSFLNPILMLIIYTFSFSVIYKAKWGLENEGHLDFALILFASLTIFNLFADVVREAPGLVLSQPNFVKKVVFPLEILPLISLLSATVHALISLLIFLLIYGLLHFSLPWTLVFIPFVFLPLMLISLGFSFFLGSIGVYLRDIGYFINHIVTILLFTSPVFFSIERLPDSFKKILILNPVAYILENARFVMVFEKSPDWLFLLSYTIFGVLVTILGYLFFQKVRNGFADVL